MADLGPIRMVLTALWLGGYALVAVAMIAFAAAYWRNRAVREIEFLVLGATVGAGASLLYLGVLVVPSFPFKVLVWKGFQVMASIVLLCWFVFVARWTEHPRLGRRRWLAAAALPLVAFDALLLTNGSPWFAGLHSLYWKSATVATPLGAVAAPSFSFEPLAAAGVAYDALLLLATVALLVAFAARDDQRLYRLRNALLAVAPVAAVAVALAFAVLGLPFDPQPVGYVFANTFAAVAVLRFGVFDVVSLPDDSLLEAIDGGVLVYGTDGRVVDANRVARAVMDVPDGVVGRDVVATVETASTLPNLRTDGAGTTTAGRSLDDPGAVGDLLDGHELTTTVDGESRTYLVGVSELDDAADTHIGWTVLFYDVTALRQKQQELDLLKQVLSRVLRHNVRNELTVIRANARMLAEEAAGLDRERLETIVEKSDDLLDASEKARTVERLVEGDRGRSDLDLVDTVESYVAAEASGAFPEVTFETSLPESLTVRAHWALPVAIENVIENAAEHNDGDDPTVEVTVERERDRAILEVRDDGPGISRAELDVLDRREETQLQHGSGVGLWLVDWIVDLSHGDLSFESNEPRGTVARIELPAGES